MAEPCDPRILPSEDGLDVIFFCSCGYETDILGGSPGVGDIIRLAQKHRIAVRMDNEPEA